MTAIVKLKPEDWLFYSFAVFVFCSTFSIALSQAALGVALVLFLVVVIRQRYQPFGSELKWFYLTVGLYLFWLVVSAVVGGEPLQSLFMAREEWLFCIVPVGLYVLLQRRQNADRLVAVLAAGVVLMSLFALGEFVWLMLEGTLPPEIQGIIRIAGNFSHPLTFGNFMAVAALFLLGYVLVGYGSISSWSRRLMLIGGIGGIVSTLLSNGRGPIVAMFIGLLIMLFFLKRRKILLGLILVVAVALAVCLVEGISSRFTTNIRLHSIGDWHGSRLFIWKNTATVIRENPWFGTGPGKFKEAYVEAADRELPSKRRYGHAHNDILNITAQTGIPGGIWFACIWVSVLGYLWTGWRRAGPDADIRRFSAAALLGSLVFLGTSITEATFADEEVRALMMFVWAIGLFGRYNNKLHAIEKVTG